MRVVGAPRPGNCMILPAFVPTALVARVAEPLDDITFLLGDAGFGAARRVTGPVLRTNMVGTRVLRRRASNRLEFSPIEYKTGGECRAALSLIEEPRT